MKASPPTPLLQRGEEKEKVKAAIKREQSDACISYAERLRVGELVRECVSRFDVKHQK